MYDGDLVQARFKALKAQKRFKSARALVELTGLPRYTINKIVSGNIQDASDRIQFLAILEKLGMTEEEFFGRPAKPKPAAEIKKDKSIPLYGEIPAGHPNMNEGFPAPDEWIEAVPGIRNRRVFALRVHGLSMSPHLLPGDIVFLEPVDLHLGPKEKECPAPQLLFERLHGRIVAALVDGEATLKVLRLTPIPEKGDFDLHLLPINPTFPEIYIKDETDIRFQGIVLKTLRDETASALTLVKGG